MIKQQILTIEDDHAILRGIVDAFCFAGYRTLEGPTARWAWKWRSKSKSAQEAAHSAPGIMAVLALSRRLVRDMGRDLIYTAIISPKAPVLS